MLTPDSRSLFLFASDLTYLNHGGYGATPRSVLDEKKRILDEIEKNPMDFLAHKIGPQWHQVAEKIASRFSSKPNSVAIVDNATDGIEAVLRSLSLKTVDEILITSMTYGAVAMARNILLQNKALKSRWPNCAFPIPNPNNASRPLLKPSHPARKSPSSITLHRPQRF
jgi:isopenicillin-N epimerase